MKYTLSENALYYGVIGAFSVFALVAWIGLGPVWGWQRLRSGKSL